MNGTRVIVDTNVVSYLMRGGSLAERYRPHLRGRLSAIAFVTVGELYFGAEKAEWGAMTHNAKDFRSVESLALITEATGR